MNYGSLNYDMKVRIFNRDKFFGPGVARILHLVKETGTLSEAYKIMGISSSKAWKILKRSEADLGIKLIETETGGSGGGKSKLTSDGEELLNRYEFFVNELDKTANLLFQKYFDCDTINRVE